MMFGLGLPRTEWICDDCGCVWFGDVEDKCPVCDSKNIRVQGGIKLEVKKKKIRKR